MTDWYNGTVLSLTDRNINSRIAPFAQFFEFDGKVYWRDTGNAVEYRDIYTLCSPFSSIINKCAGYYAGGKIEVLNSNTDNYVRGKYKEWESLLAKPNALQTGRQFFNQLYTYRAINGFAIVLKMYPYGYSDRPSKLWVLPYWCLQFEQQRESPYLLDRDKLLQGIYFAFNGERTELDPKYLMLITDDVDLYDERTWLPKSRIELISQDITLCLSAVECDATMMQKRGALGFIADQTADAVGAVAMKSEAKKEIQRQFHEQYGLSRSQSNVIITSANLRYESMTMPFNDLGSDPIFLKGAKGISDALNYPFELTAWSDRKIQNNTETFSRNLFQDKIIPDSTAIDEQLTAQLIKDEPVIIRHDYSHVPALQKSEEEKGKGRKSLNEAYLIEWNNGTCTRNDWRKALGEDEILKPEFELFKFELTPEQLGVVTQNIDNGQKPDNSNPKA